jgi:hypothetical protein
MGIEWIKITRDVPLVRTWKASSPAAMLRDITKAYGYEFEEANGVVHVYPAPLHRDSANVLNTRIDSFEVQGQYVSFAAFLLSAKLKPIMVPPDPRRRGGGTAGSIPGGADGNRISFTMHNVTVREVLDKLCLSANSNIWILAYPRAPVRTRGGFLKTIPLHTSVQRDDDGYLPDWVFRRWGFNPFVAD